MPLVSPIASALLQPLRLPLRSARVVVPARESPAVAEALAHLVLELPPGPADAETEAVVLRLLVVADPVVRRLAVGLALVHHAAGGAVLVVGDAVGGEHARGDRPDGRHLGIVAVVLEGLRAEEGLQPRLEERLVLLHPDAVLLRQLVPALA